MRNFSQFLAPVAAAFLLVAAAVPAQAKITLAFWSQEFGEYFPHAFFSMRGYVDETSQPVNEYYGFTLTEVTPAVLFGDVPGEVRRTENEYLSISEVQFQIEISDAQYRALKRIVESWDSPEGNRYNLSDRNCIHFVAVAARIAGLDADVPESLTKRPRSYLEHVARVNRDKVRVLDMSARDYFKLLKEEDARDLAARRRQASGD